MATKKTGVHRCKKPQKPKRVLVTVLVGVGGHAVYLNNSRIIGEKPWGGGKVVYEGTASLTDIKDALRGA